MGWSQVYGTQFEAGAVFDGLYEQEQKSEETMRIEEKKILYTDILIIGGGTAGCYAALSIREKSDYSIS